LIPGVFSFAGFLTNQFSSRFSKSRFGLFHRRIELYGGCFLNAWKAMGIQIQRDRDTGMPKAFCNCLRIYALL